MYNDWFGKSLAIFPSLWKNTYTADKIDNSTYVDIDPKGKLLKPYPVGLDPVWAVSYNNRCFKYYLMKLLIQASDVKSFYQQVSTNKILIQNSIKMKLSIVIGVIHMMFGLSLSFFNYL